MAGYDRELCVVIQGQLAATLTVDRNGMERLAYLDGYRGTPVSLSMPTTRRAYQRRQVLPFLDGLLPDNPLVREALGARFGVSPLNPFALISHIGAECAGAVQIVPPSALEATLAGQGSLTDISDRDIRLRLTEPDQAGWVREGESWSLAGAQHKIALRYTTDGRWAEARGAEPTTHIIKPGITHLPAQALNEHICQATAIAARVPTARTAYTRFDGLPALVVERYDRSGDAGRVIRAHQEDMCQALSIPPKRKYADDGGPNATDIVRLLQTAGRPSDRQHNPYAFARLLMFNYLIGAPDSHAKNFSAMLVGDAVILAPGYDIASGLPYRGYDRFAFRIGNRNQFGQITEADWQTWATHANLDPDQVTTDLRTLAHTIPDALNQVIHSDQLATTDTTPLRSMLPAVADLCASVTGAKST